MTVAFAQVSAMGDSLLNPKISKLSPEFPPNSNRSQDVPACQRMRRRAAGSISIMVTV